MPSRAALLAAGLLSGHAEALAAVGGMLRKRGVITSFGAESTTLNSAAAAPTEAAQSGVSGGGPSPGFDVKNLPGVTAPLGFFDPLNFCEDASEGKIRFYREVEIKHSRVAMLAALGFVVGEQFHPLFGGQIDVPSYVAFQQTPLQTFWGVVLIVISVAEVFSVFSFQSPFGGEPWTVRTDYSPGDLGWDPLGVKPTNAAELKAMQTRELNNGRLAMIGAAGMIAQELATGQKLF